MLGNGSRLYFFAIALAVSALAGCSSGYAPVTERSLGARASGPTPAHYTVRSGDTLYSIAWRYGLDYRQLARINGIDRHYTIYPGQKLKLRVGASSAPHRISHPSGTKIAKSSPTKTKPHRDRRSKAPVVHASGPVHWRWPATGRILARYSTGTTPNKGIDLAGKVGDPVYAAADGKVVYAGSGLLGYGNLVIVDHNQQYLSAYAHNSRIFVKESDKVKAGEKIAEIGNTGSNRPMLHFEIRRDGKPVNPLKYLPKK